MSLLAGPFAIACVLLAVGGVAKAIRPVDTSGALRAMRLPSSPTLVRVGGVAEALIAVAALVTAFWLLAYLVAASYLAFTLFVFGALRAGKPLSSCGCFGKIDTPPSVIHVAIDLAAAAVAVGIALTGDAALPHVLENQPLAGVPFLLLVAMGAYLTFLAFSALPKTMAAVREVGR
jgi:hypothetical protein